MNLCNCLERLNLKEKQIRYDFCPHCGKHGLNSFLGEPFPKGHDSPFRKTLKGFYNLIGRRNHYFRQTYGRFCDLEGPETWDMIASAIKDAHVCFFDFTGEIFNVGFEFGYTLTQWKENWNCPKHVVCGSSHSPEDHLLSYMNLFNILEHNNKDIADSVQDYFIHNDFRNTTSVEIIDRIKMFYSRISSFLFDPKIGYRIDKTYSGIDYPAKKRGKDVLLISAEPFSDEFNINDDGLTSFRTLNSESISFFSDLDSNHDLIHNICERIIKKYDFIIIHLLTKVKDDYDDYAKHNFICSIISGMMRGFKEVNKESNSFEVKNDFYFANRDSKKPQLRCSDVNPIRRYRNKDEMNSRLNEILQIISRY